LSQLHWNDHVYRPPRALSEANLLGDETITGAIAEDPDLHDHIIKGLYEAETAS
jgi:hypothetical protein